MFEAVKDLKKSFDFMNIWFGQRRIEGVELETSRVKIGIMIPLSL